MRSLDSERESLKTWEAVPYTELPSFASEEKTNADLGAILPLLSNEDLVLDLGCGWGRITLELAKKHFRVTGVDLSPNLIEYARSMAKTKEIDCEFEVASMLDLPYSDHTFDKVLCLWGVFSHLLTLEDQIAATNQIFRIMRLGGVAFIEMGNGESKRNKLKVQREGFGPDKRTFVYQYKDNPNTNTLYMHNRETLRRVARLSNFNKYAVKFKNINHKRRLVMFLYKD
jgi:ubiquinone/menaquinone biosynthesis C-methylase UbiE